jgi:hypothetical protein
MNCENWEVVKECGQDKPCKEAVDAYDKEHGEYEESTGGKPTVVSIALPNTPQPFGNK